MNFQIEVYGLTDIGLVREQNEDAWGQIPDRAFYVLCDGMGGHKGGEVASQVAVNSLSAFAEDRLPPLGKEVKSEAVEALLKEGIGEANRHVCSLSDSDPELSNMGTTLCCLHISPKSVVYAHVGDSRIYRMRGGTLEQITIDHSLVAELQSAGQISDDEAKQFEYKHIVTRAVGTSASVTPETASGSWKKGDLYMMCSDGLSDAVSLDQMSQILQKQASLQDAGRALIKAAYDSGGTDNITLVLIRPGVS